MGARRCARTLRGDRWWNGHVDNESEQVGQIQQVKRMLDERYAEKAAERQSAFRTVLIACGLLLVLSAGLPILENSRFLLLIINPLQFQSELVLQALLPAGLGALFVSIALIRRLQDGLVAVVVLVLIGASLAVGADLMSILALSDSLSPGSAEFWLPGDFSRGRTLVAGCIALSAGVAATGTQSSNFLRRTTLATGICICGFYYLGPLFYSPPSAVGLGPFTPPYLRFPDGYSGALLNIDMLVTFLAIFCYWTPGLVAVAAGAAWWRVQIGRQSVRAMLWYAWALRLVPLVIVLPMAVRVSWFAGDGTTFFGMARLYVLFGVAVVVAASAIFELLTYPAVNVFRRLAVSDVSPTAG